MHTSDGPCITPGARLLRVCPLRASSCRRPSARVRPCRTALARPGSCPPAGRLAPLSPAQRHVGRYARNGHTPGGCVSGRMRGGGARASGPPSDATCPASDRVGPRRTASDLPRVVSAAAGLTSDSGTFIRGCARGAGPNARPGAPPPTRPVGSVPTDERVDGARHPPARRWVNSRPPMGRPPPFGRRERHAPPETTRSTRVANPPPPRQARRP